MKNNTTYLTILFLLLILNACTNPVIEPENALCTQDARTFAQNYIKHRCDTCDNRVISFTYEQVKEYLEYMQSKAEELSIDEDILGFRVYLGAKHEQEFEEKDLIKGDARQIGNAEGDFYTTVFFVPTINLKNSSDAGDYENMYEIAPFNHGSSRRPPNPYDPDEPCPVALTNSSHTH
ncbi:hypothetical protein [uncultured Kordia sp.]|uniref:hypothetical protein n=1 Tax=uncultured Kordia sp. TaxID=507699 RepID=UPI002615538E|nr:hypothetical protein [uncultured Kordia sp.]